MAKQLSELLTGWENDVDVSTFSEEAQDFYNSYREYNRKAAESRAAFEALVNADMPSGTHAVFNYRFGKLSMSVADGRKPVAQAKAKPAGTSLAQFLALAKSNGRNA